MHRTAPCLLLADEQLREPQREPLPPNSLGALEQEHLGHPSGPHRFPQPLSYCFMSSQGCQSHPPISLIPGHNGRGAKTRNLMFFNMLQ